MNRVNTSATNPIPEHQTETVTAPQITVDMLAKAIARSLSKVRIYVLESDIAEAGERAKAAAENASF
jgi:hypothetical protein